MYEVLSWSLSRSNFARPGLPNPGQNRGFSNPLRAILDLLSLDQFPVVYERGEPKAVLVDFSTFQRLAFILDNLQNRGPEPEDVVLAESPEFHRLVERVRAVAKLDRG